MYGVSEADDASPGNDLSVGRSEISCWCQQLVRLCDLYSSVDSKNVQAPPTGELNN